MQIDRIDEEFLLLALSADGDWSVGASSLQCGLAGAWLGELLVEDRIELEKGHVRNRNVAPMNDPALDWVMKRLRKTHRHAVGGIVRRLSTHTKPRIKQVMGRLEQRGHIERQGAGYKISNKQVVTEVRQHLDDVLHQRVDPGKPDLALLSVADGAGLLEPLFGSDAHKRLRGLLRTKPRLTELSHAIKSQRHLGWLRYIRRVTRRADSAPNPTGAGVQYRAISDSLRRPRRVTQVAAPTLVARCNGFNDGTHCQKPLMVQARRLL